MASDAHIMPTISDRGFKTMPPVPASWGGHETGEVVVYESSAAEAPHLWLRVNAAPGFGGTAETVSAHLPLDEAEKLRDQLTWLIENHYQVEPADD